MYIKSALDVGEKMVCGFVLGYGVYRLGTYAEGVLSTERYPISGHNDNHYIKSRQHKCNVLAISMHRRVAIDVLFQLLLVISLPDRLLLTCST
jgi:hypothetical protein